MAGWTTEGGGKRRREDTCCGPYGRTENRAGSVDSGCRRLLPMVLGWRRGWRKSVALVPAPAV